VVVAGLVVVGLVVVIVVGLVVVVAAARSQAFRSRDLCLREWIKQAQQQVTKATKIERATDEYEIYERLGPNDTTVARVIAFLRWVTVTARARGVQKMNGRSQGHHAALARGIAMG